MVPNEELRILAMHFESPREDKLFVKDKMDACSKGVLYNELGYSTTVCVHAFYSKLESTEPFCVITQ